MPKTLLYCLLLVNEHVHITEPWDPWKTRNKPVGTSNPFFFSMNQARGEQLVVVEDKKPPQAVRLAAGVAANGTRAPQRAKAAVGEASWCKKWPKGVEGALTASGQAFLHNTYTHILVLCNLRHIQYRYILYIVYIYNIKNIILQ